MVKVYPGSGQKQATSSPRSLILADSTFVLLATECGHVVLSLHLMGSCAMTVEDRCQHQGYV